ncbi:histone-lysine N-methyltransferase [Plakobranchus ocellatus]|uniref:[histone H4]-lysine(20) N-methyltransferase n=1 Tax=Plakobranchus ocellatus TaxID=259542 RepID=A0AAV4DUR5_9GAST|nr:histone-lysine N-methyltransferase [Plakobranchus ocellatus]
MDTGKSSQKNLSSPPPITDHFRASKRNSHRKKSGVKREAAASSVYLTPESSPGSHCSSDSPPKETGAQEDTAVASSPDKKVVSKISQHSDQDRSLECTPLPPQSEAQETNANNVSPHMLVHSDVPLPDSSQSPEKCISENQQGTQGSESKQIVSSDVELLKNCSSPVLSSVQSSDSIASSSSPSLPRPKQRKSTNSKSKSQVDASATAKDGDSLKPKPGRRKKKDSSATNNKVITDFFPVRRSGRQTKADIEKEKLHQLEQQILAGCEDGLEVKEFESKGRGVVATKNFQRGDFVVEYAGDLIDLPAARAREEKYAENPEIGCYMYYFKCGSQQFCVDATSESGKLGRLLNHSSKDGNCCTRSLEIKGTARLILVAKRDIHSGEELTYDYGDRSKAAIEAHPWLKL